MSGVRRPQRSRRAERFVGVRRVSAGGDEMQGHAPRRQVLAGVLAPRGVCAGTDAGRTWAAEGHGRRLIFCTRNRMDPISGFAKNSGALGRSLENSNRNPGIILIVPAASRQAILRSQVEITLGVALTKNLVRYCFAIEFIRTRQAASRTVKLRCLAFTPVSERSRFPAAPYLATCLLCDSAPPTGRVGSLLNDTEKLGDKGSADHRMSCAHHWAYSISSFLPPMSANGCQ